ncbi:MAG TPA: hypothetical protein VFA26_20690 [Gemmataceae bacterium]|nr:hypothetical protein [Gemmataceae bacterium]
MRVRILPVALVCLVALPAVARPADDKKADKKPSQPTVIIRLKSLDGLLADVKYLAALAGRGDEVKNFEGILKARAGGDKALEGFDRKRPLGAYGHPGPQGVDSTVVLMLPVKDEKAALRALDNFNLKAEKEKDGSYSVTPEGAPFSIYFRFANQYVYITPRDPDAIAPGNLLKPEDVLPEGQTGLASVTVRLDQIDPKAKEAAVAQLDLQMAELKDKQTGDLTELQKALSDQIAREVANRIKAVITEGRELTLKADVDRKKGDLHLDLSVDGQPGSKLAGSIKDLGRAKSVFGGLTGKDSAANVLFHYLLPEKVRQSMGPALEEAFKKAQADEKDDKKRELSEKLYKALAPTLKSGDLDLAADVRGPSKDGTYTLVAAAKVRDGEAVEQGIKEVIKELPEEAKGLVTLNAEKAGSVRIHKIDAEQFYDEDARKMFGKGPIWFAVSNNMAVLAAGEDALKALKDALALEPKAARTLQAEVSLKRLAPLMAKEHKAAPKAAEEAFKAPHDDTIRLTLEGGQSLRLRASMKAAVIKFFHLLEEAQKDSAAEK